MSSLLSLVLLNVRSELTLRNLRSFLAALEQLDSVAAAIEDAVAGSRPTRAPRASATRPASDRDAPRGTASRQTSFRSLSHDGCARARWRRAFSPHKTSRSNSDLRVHWARGSSVL